MPARHSGWGAMPSRSTSTNSLMRIGRRSGRRWINPGIEVLRHQGVLESFRHPVQGRGDHLGVDVVAELATLDPELDELEGAVRVLAAHEPVDRPADVQARCRARDQRHAVRHRIRSTSSSARWSHQSNTAQNPCSTTSAGASSQAGSRRDGSLERLEEQRFLGAEVQEDGALRHADLGGHVLDAGTSVAPVGELPHRGIEDPITAGLSHAATYEGGGNGRASGAKRENPRDLWLAGNRSSQPPSAPRALVPQATSAIFARLPDRRRWFALRLPSAFAGSGSPRGVPFPTDPRLARLAAFPAGPPGPASRPSPMVGAPLGSLRILLGPSRPDHLAMSRPLVRPSRVDHLDCLERGERYRWPLRRVNFVSPQVRVRMCR